MSRLTWPSQLRKEEGRTIYRANLLATLRQRELARVARQLSDELGLGYAEAKPGQRIEGVYRRPVDLASGRYALIEKAYASGEDRGY